MDYIALLCIIIVVLIFGLVVFSIVKHEIDKPDLTPVQLYNLHHTKTEEVFREEQLVPDNYNVPRSQPLLGISFGRAPCVKCNRASGNCKWSFKIE